jgi:hypothetical protein
VASGKCPVAIHWFGLGTHDRVDYLFNFLLLFSIVGSCFALTNQASIRVSRASCYVFSKLLRSKISRFVG